MIKKSQKIQIVLGTILCLISLISSISSSSQNLKYDGGELIENKDNFIFLADQSNEIKIYDLDTQMFFTKNQITIQNLSEIHSVPLVNRDCVTTLKIMNNLLIIQYNYYPNDHYMAQTPTKILVYNIEDINNIFLISEYDDLKISFSYNSYLYLKNYSVPESFFFPNGSITLQIYNISNSNSFDFLTSVDLNMSLYSDENCIIGNSVYLNGVDLNFIQLNLSNPLNPFIMSTYNKKSDFNTSYTHKENWIVINDYLYIYTNWHIYIYKIHLDNSLSFSNDIYIDSYILTSLRYYNNHIIFGTYDGVEFYDISDPKNPKFIKIYSRITRILDIKIFEDSLIILNKNYMDKISLDNISRISSGFIEPYIENILFGLGIFLILFASGNIVKANREDFITNQIQIIEFGLFLFALYEFVSFSSIIWTQFFWWSIFLIISFISYYREINLKKAQLLLFYFIIGFIIICNEIFYYQMIYNGFAGVGFWWNYNFIELNVPAIGQFLGTYLWMYNSELLEQYVLMLFFLILTLVILTILRSRKKRKHMKLLYTEINRDLEKKELDLLKSTDKLSIKKTLKFLINEFRILLSTPISHIISKNKKYWKKIGLKLLLILISLFIIIITWNIYISNHDSRIIFTYNDAIKEIYSKNATMVFRTTLIIVILALCGIFVKIVKQYIIDFQSLKSEEIHILQDKKITESIKKKELGEIN